MSILLDPTLEVLSAECKILYTDFDSHEESIGSVFDAKYKILERMRLACEIFGEDDRPVKRCPTTGEGIRKF